MELRLGSSEQEGVNALVELPLEDSHEKTVKRLQNSQVRRAAVKRPSCSGTIHLEPTTMA